MEVFRNDFLGQYRAISSKLKKRFLRKPNVSEASEQFSLLTKELQRQECPHYAAFCCLAVARCEHTLGNFVGETQALIQSARMFLEAEQQNHQLQCPSFGEHLNVAISCYNQAVRTLLEQKQVTLAASLCLELGDVLVWLGRQNDAVAYFQKAAVLQNQCALTYLNALEKVVGCKLDLGDLEGARHALSEMTAVAQEKVALSCGRIVGVFGSILGEAEVTKLLLLLFLQPPFQKLTQEEIQTMDKFNCESSESDSAANYLGDDLLLLLQSLQMACHAKDLESVKALQKDLWSLLSAQQNTLLHKVVTRMTETAS